MDKGQKYSHAGTSFTNGKMPVQISRAQKRKACGARRHAFAGMHRSSSRSVGLERLLGSGDPPKEEQSSFTLVNLNKQVLEDIASIIHKNNTADLKNIIVQYEAFIREIEGLKDCDPASSLGSRDARRTHAYRAGCCSTAKDAATGDSQNTAGGGLDMQYRGKDEIRSEHQALQALFGKKASVESSRDTLSLLLDENCPQEEVQNMEFNYIKLEDVVKSKGNSINGPKREDVGRYNRKLFDMQFSEAKSVSNVSVEINSKFFPELHRICETSKILRCEAVVVSYFDRQSVFLIGEFFVVIHRKSVEILCTIKNRMRVLFDQIEREATQAIYAPGCTNIVFLYLDSFILYSLAFASAEAASEVYGLFFA